MKSKLRNKKRVVVVGGGPAGMEAARIAALRGHDVTLYEREHQLGGLLPLAAMVKGTEIEDLPALVNYLKTQVNRFCIKIKLGVEVSRSLIEEIKPDVLILAMGGEYFVPEIPGINRRNVIRSNDLNRRLKLVLRFLKPSVVRWLTSFWMPVGKRVVIIGGAIQGCELAEFLVKRGRKVTIVDSAKTLGDGLLEWIIKPSLLTWLNEKGVTAMLEVKYDEITNNGLFVITKEGKRELVAADTIVTALPLRPNTEFAKTLEGTVPEIYTIGDCKEPKLIADAIADGSYIARVI